MIGLRRGQPVISGIRKRPVAAAWITLDLFNLEGDRQADLRAHGGVDKAVFAYPVEHLVAWSEECDVRPALEPGSFGENLTLQGVTEEQVCIGDVWAWGEALLQVAQPRWPCYKLSMATGIPEIVERFIETGRCGWYFRVLRPGRVPVRGPIAIAERHPARVSVRQAQRARLPGAPRDLIERVVAVDALAPAWRQPLLSRVEQAAPRD
jgi:MOSC domain-containing protein YiiM